MDNQFQNNLATSSGINEGNSVAGESVTKKPLPLLYIIIAIVFLLVIFGVFIFIKDIFSPVEVNLSLKNNVGVFNGEAVVSNSGENHLVWDSINAKSCKISSDVEGYVFEVSTNDKSIKEYFDNAEDVLLGADYDPLYYLPKDLPVSLSPGEKITYTLNCDGVTDSIKIVSRNFKLTDFRKAENRWFENFKDKEIPTDSYKAYYFNSNNPNTILKTENSPKVAINSDLLLDLGSNLELNDLGIYLIGNFVVKESGNYSISASDSWSDFRVIINGYVIPTEQEVSLGLEPGTYQIEVEYLNNTEYVDFAMNFEKEVMKYSSTEVFEKISSLDKSFEVWYVGAYESRNSDRTITVNLDKAPSSQVVLVLSSYSQVNWKVVNNKNIEVPYIIYGSSEPGTSVTTSDKKIEILKVGENTLANEYTLEAECNNEYGDNFHCENIDGLTKIDSGIKTLTGKKIDGYSGAYDVSSIVVPETIINDKVREQITKSYEDIIKNRDEKDNKQKLENIF